jgi:hypothetical protein
VGDRTEKKIEKNYYLSPSPCRLSVLCENPTRREEVLRAGGEVEINNYILISNCNGKYIV